MNLKKTAAEKAVEAIKDGMCIGLGTGSTAYWAIQKIGERVREGLKIEAVATSVASEELAVQLGVPIVPFENITRLDITIDGADEVSPQLHLIKGGGGALLREKIVAANTDYFIVVADESKAVDTLGSFALPVEVVPFASEWTKRRLEASCPDVQWRLKDGVKYITDNGNYIADCRYGEIHDPAELEAMLNSIPGVVDNGLFVGMADKVIIAKSDGELDIRVK
ncbi:ribose-5-phosphate isomerase RpiA [Paenibacillus jiagnxiensis]|uniref:ribose-5-phosphate isomerase RpiA n=1 Tax=Paenibacillus jiagnxiensis TaxID=3228926 RepID=UPI0033B0ED19